MSVNGRCNHGIYRGAPFLPGCLKQINDLGNVAFIYNGAKGTLIYASATAYALLVVDMRLAVLVHFNGAGLACPLAGTHIFRDGAVRAGGYALAAGNAFAVINVRLGMHPLVDKGDSPFGTSVGTTMRYTSPACIADGNLTHGAFVTCNGQNLNFARDILMASQRHLNPLVDNGSFLVNAATHGGNRSGHDRFRNSWNTRSQLVILCQTGDLTQYFVL